MVELQLVGHGCTLEVYGIMNNLFYWIAYLPPQLTQVTIVTFLTPVFYFILFMELTSVFGYGSSFETLLQYLH